MSAYKRFVSYLYEYDHRKKGKNRGFVRVEVRNHQCCLELHMTLPACPFIPVFRAYAFVARPGALHGLFLGNPSWKRLTESYPHVTPFFDEEIHNCLQLSPKDLSLLGSFGVSCGNNQFFLYGSHAFQHFLLGKMEHEDTICYILAVPGIYAERERLLANLFGFPYFKSARAKNAQPGHFGYWYRTIHTEPQNPDPISPESQPVESFSEESAENSPAARASKT